MRGTKTQAYSREVPLRLLHLLAHSTDRQVGYAQRVAVQTARAHYFLNSQREFRLQCLPIVSREHRVPLDEVPGPRERLRGNG